MAISRRGENAGDQLPTVLQKVGVAQHLNQQLPLDAAFVDETGKAVKLGDYFGKKPAILALVYYTCPMLCSEEMDGLTSSLEMVKLTPGKDFDVVIVEHRSQRYAGAGCEVEGFICETIWTSGDGCGMALPDGTTAGD